MLSQQSISFIRAHFNKREKNMIIAHKNIHLMGKQRKETKVSHPFSFTFPQANNDRKGGKEESGYVVARILLRAVSTG